MGRGLLLSETGDNRKKGGINPSPTELLFQLFPLVNCQLVAAVIFGVGGVSFDPVVVNLVLHGEHQQFFPEIRVQSGLFIGLDPALFPPAPCPALFQGIDDIFGIGIQLYVAGLFQRLQAPDHGGKLHPVIGGVCFAAGELFFVTVIFQDGAPAPGTGVAGASTVSIQCYGFHTIIPP